MTARCSVDGSDGALACLKQLWREDVAAYHKGVVGLGSAAVGLHGMGQLLLQASIALLAGSQLADSNSPLALLHAQAGHSLMGSLPGLPHTCLHSHPHQTDMQECIH